MKESEKADRNVDAKAIIEAVLSHVGMRAPSFAKAIGINYQRIFDLQSGRTKKFNPGVVNMICERFPDINKNYLYTGEGNLVIPGKEQPTSDAGSVIQLSEMLSMQRTLLEMFQTLSERESRLQERMADLQDREREISIREAELNKKESELMRVLEENGLKKDGEWLEA